MDDRVELDGFFQSAFVQEPPGFHRPPEDFARALPPVADRGAAPPASASFESRAQYLLRLGPAPALDGEERVPAFVAAQVGPPAAVARWLSALRALARTPRAAAALSAERRELAPALADFRARLSSGSFVAAVEEYAGLPLPGEHRVVLSPFHSAAGVANVVQESPDGSVSIVSLLGPERRGGAAVYWGRRTPGTLWHEEAHGVLDPLADAWGARIDRALPADASAVCYGAWRQCVREHVVRAVMIRLLERRLGPAAAADQLAFEDPARFRWLVPMIESLKAYEADRKRWPTLADYYPRLLDAARPEADDGSAPFRADREPPAVRARIARLARTAIPLMRDPSARLHLRAALAVAETVVPAAYDAAPPGTPGSAPSPDAPPGIVR